VTGSAGALLVVDDDEAKRYLLTTWLRRAGYSVAEAGSGEEALAKAGDAELVLLDVNLPDMSGFEVCRLIKADARTAATPVIQVSATAVEVADRAHGLTQGADAYLAHPTEPAELLATVTAVLRYSRARQRAERSAALLTELATVTLDVNAAETFDGLASAAAAGAARMFAATAVLSLEMPDGHTRRTSARPGYPGTVRRGGPPGLGGRIADLVLGPGPASAVALVGRDEWLAVVPDSTLDTDVFLAAARTKPGRPPAAIAVHRAGVFGTEDTQILRQLVQSIALGVEALRASAEEHLVALTLQRSFLPVILPTVPGLKTAYRYLPASDQAEVGGDFYEALPWPGGRMLVAIGDVQGHSLQAATVMGELRHALRAFVSEGHGPIAITALVNEVLRRYHPGIMATLCLMLADPATGELDIVNCGHMPVLLAEAGDGNGPATARYVGEGGLILGLSQHAPHAETAAIGAGGTALLFTDGLVEDRGILLDDNLEKLRAGAAAVAGTAGADIESFANHTMSLFGSREDDVAMIAVRRVD
jgi:DNA-binding response OmpR family regulator